MISGGGTEEGYERIHTYKGVYEVRGGGVCGCGWVGGWVYGCGCVLGGGVREGVGGGVGVGGCGWVWVGVGVGVGVWV